MSCMNYATTGSYQGGWSWYGMISLVGVPSLHSDVIPVEVALLGLLLLNWHALIGRH